MSRFFVPPQQVKPEENIILIIDEEAHHVIDVMRMEEKDKVVIFDGTGKEYYATIVLIDKKNKIVKVDIDETIMTEKLLSLQVTLAQSIPKKGKMEYIIQKTTELGINKIIPVVTDRTIVRPTGASSARKKERWQKIALSAAKQCGRASVPEILDITPFKETVRSFGDYDKVIFAALTDNTKKLKEVVEEIQEGNILVVIGPEGGFTNDEIKKASLQKNCSVVSLGGLVLKSDTAGIFVQSVLMYTSE